jgi:uncharacterized protein YbjT (DUF2867 family)
MTPTILVVGATGNTGRSLVKTLPELLKRTKLASYRIIALTRNAESPTAQALAKLPGVELAEQNWVEIDDTWLREHEVARIFVASHNQPSQFAEEGQFLVNTLRAGVKYVVRISTTSANVRPDMPAYYPRTHWAIETMLAQPEFKELHWTSLQPNLFLPTALTPTIEFIKEFEETGKQGRLMMMIDASTGVGLIDPYDVGVVAAHLLAQEDTAPHNHAKYVLNGPEDITGDQVAKMVEQYIGEPIRNVRFRDTTFVDQMVESSSESRTVMRSIRFAPVTSWEGKAKAETTSKEIFALHTPSRTAAEVFKELVKG